MPRLSRSLLHFGRVLSSVPRKLVLQPLTKRAFFNAVHVFIWVNETTFVVSKTSILEMTFHSVPTRGYGLLERMYILAMM